MLSETKSPLVLLVEDSDDDAFFFTRTLQKSGFTCSVHHVRNGVEAVDFLRGVSDSGSQPIPQLIFLDLKMPALNGFEVLDWMRTQTFAAEMPVIVLSGSEHEDDKARAARLGAIDYLVKPVKVCDLQRFLVELCPAVTGTGARA